MAKNSRVAIIFDGRKWFLRRIRCIEHDLERDEKVYRCDKPIGTAEPFMAKILTAIVSGFKP